MVMSVGRSTGPSKATVQLVWSRDRGSCVRCGRGLSFLDRGRSWSVHHRAPRGMGGSKSPWVNLPANLLLLCGTGVTGCHSWVEANRAVSRECGWLVPRNGVQLPVEVPVFYPGIGRFLLDDDGGRRLV